MNEFIILNASVSNMPAVQDNPGTKIIRPNAIYYYH